MAGFKVIRQHRERRRARLHQEVALNLISMMDVFTVLLFFLLVNSSAVFSQVRVLGLSLPTLNAADSAPPPLDEAKLDVIVRTDALEVQSNAWGGDARRRLINYDGHHDVKSLAKLLAQAKQAWPTKKDINLLVELDVNYEDLVRVMDAARVYYDRKGAVELFPEVTLGEAPREGGAR